MKTLLRIAAMTALLLLAACKQLYRPTEQKYVVIHHCISQGHTSGMKGGKFYGQDIGEYEMKDSPGWTVYKCPDDLYVVVDDRGQP